MSRSKNKHHASWNYPKRQAKHWSNKQRRVYGRCLESKLKDDLEGNSEMPAYLPKNAGRGDIWIYD